VSSVSWLVVIVRTTSTSFIAGTGLKKWSPSIRSGRPQLTAIAAIVRLDVFDAKIVAGGHTELNSFHSEFLRSRSSETASITISLSLNPRTSVMKLSLLRVASRCSGVIFSFFTAFARDLSTLARDFSLRLSEISRTIVWHPVIAQTCAIPLPISPPPSTPTR